MSSLLKLVALIVVSLPVSVSRSKQPNEPRGVEISIKIAVFADLQLVKHLEDGLNFRSAQMKETFLQAYVAQMDSLFGSLSSELISRIHLQLVDIRYEQAAGQFTANSTSSSVDLVLGSFCLHQELARKDRRAHRVDWDFGLLLTARDICDEQEDSAEVACSLVGMSPVGGIQWPDLSCAVVEFATGYNESIASSEGPKATRGMLSAWVAAHELGHNLGLHHDGQPFNVDCDDGLFMMARYHPDLAAPTSRHAWSECSSRELDSLDWRRFILHDGGQHQDSIGGPRSLPGRVLDADLQCKIFGQQLTMNRSWTDLDCTGPLICLTREGEPVPIGPALEGTRCSQSEEFHCTAGSCIRGRSANYL